jgi:hypothetical protein
VQVTRGELRVTNEVRVAGRVQAEQAPNTLHRTSVVGWEDVASEKTRGRFHPFSVDQGRYLPVEVRQPKP